MHAALGPARPDPRQLPLPTCLRAGWTRAVAGDRLRRLRRGEDVAEDLLARLDALFETDVEPRLDERLLRRGHRARRARQRREQILGDPQQLIGARRAVDQPRREL